jgi:hypothetical protein
MSKDEAARQLSEGWGAQIQVEQAYRDAWVAAFAKPFENWIERHDDGLYLRSVFFKSCPSQKEVKPIAIDILRVLAGAMALTHPPYEVRFQGVVKVDGSGKRQITAFMEGGTYVTFFASGNNGGEPAARTAVRRAFSSEYLEEALAYFGDQGGWFDLYKCIESVELWAGGEHKLAALNLTHSGDLKRTKKTANDARHARLKNTPPANAPSFLEARNIVKDLLNAALAMQATSASNSQTGSRS